MAYLTKKTANYFLLGTNYAVLIGVWFWNAVTNPDGNQLAGGPETLLVALGCLSGLLAMTALLLQLLMIGRVRWVESAFGLDRLSRVHQANGYLLLFFIVSHVGLLLGGYAVKNFSGVWEQFVELFENGEDIPQTVLGVGIFAGVISLSLPWIKQRLKYEAWYLSHLSVYAAMALVIPHQFANGQDFEFSRGLEIYVYGLYVFVFGNFIFFHFMRPLIKFAVHRFKVDRVVAETPDVTSIYISGRFMDRFKIEAGQFMIFRFLAKKFWLESHPFSLSCHPNGNTLRLSAKKLGDFTKRLPELKAGTSVIVDGPLGVFTAKAARKDKILLLAGGIGITPLRSMAEEFIKLGKDTILLFAARAPKDIVLKEELDGLTHSEKFKAVYICEDPAWQGEKGRLDQDRLARLVPDILVRDIYLCGPPVMANSLHKILKKMKVPAGQVHSERFAL